MSNLNDRNPLSYQGVSAYNPPELYIEPRDPKGSDYEQYSLGAIWINKTDDKIFVLMDQANRTSTWVEFYPGAAGNCARDFPCDIGTAVADNGILQVLGGNNIYTHGAANVLTISLTDNVEIIGTLTMAALGPGVVQVQDNGLFMASRGEDGEVLIGSTGNDAAWANIISSNGSIGITNGPHTIDLRVVGGGAGGAITDLEADDANTASPVGGVIKIYGGDNINTVAAVDTLYIHLNKSIVLPATNAAGDQGLYSLDGHDFMHSYGSANTFLGEDAGNRTLTVLNAINNTGLGKQSLRALTDSPNNVAAGYHSLTLLSTGDGKNVALGSNSLVALVDGGYNIALGYFAGSNYTGSESSNILICSIGVLGEANKIHIGTQGSGVRQQDACYIAGIYNTAIGAVNHLVSVDDTGKLGLVGGIGDGYLLIGGAGANPTWQRLISGDGTVTFAYPAPHVIDIRAIGGGGGGAVTALDSDAGVANPVAGVITIAGGDNINTAGDASTITVHLDKSIAQPATNADGLEGLYSLGGFDFMHAYGTDNTFLGKNAGNRTLTVVSAIDNTGIGHVALRSITTASSCTAVGSQSQFSNISSDHNTSLGASSLFSLTSGDGYNTAIGYTSMYNAIGNTSKCTAVGYSSLRSPNNTTECTCIGYRAGENMTGNFNTALGAQSLMNLVTGTNNTCIGSGSGQNFSGAESNNICIGDSGVMGESNVIRINSGLIIMECYIAGIYGNLVGGAKGVVFVNSNNQLGTSAGTDGQLLIGKTGSHPLWGTLTSSDASIEITYNSPNIDIKAVGVGGYNNNPAFLGVQGANVANRTGNGTHYVLGTSTPLNEIFDQGNNFNPNGTFTAPYDGVYFLNMAVLYTNIDLTMAGDNTQNFLRIDTTGRNYYLHNQAVQCGEVSFSLSVVASMSAGHTARFRCMLNVIDGPGQTVGIGQSQTFASGYLVQRV